MMIMRKEQAGCNKEKRSRAPKGHFVVYVGEEMRRFVVPLSYLRSPPFQQLLEKAAEEFGFQTQNNCIVLPCDVSTFQMILEITASSSSSPPP
ncbi:Auxin responsive SAUR protein [Corchorus olitorius]|uniref:Auxin responsive SAUR protein n=1 Tax=Corchorus olitorius TaxID=93759 RepID=A0A1R3GT34_9ROSI|nr:Auxin responsive SAUR protein [Corchorus olitorius]